MKRYAVYETRRARQVKLKISVDDGLVVVVPSGFNRRRIPGIIRENQDWITDTFRKIERLHARFSGRAVTLPDTIRLQAIHEEWAVEYHFEPDKKLVLEERAGNRLVISGTIGLKSGRDLLNQWVRQKAKQHLGPWLKRTSRRTGLNYKEFKVRQQKTRWGSCSSSKNISLNQILLFVPAHLVKYLLVHELCHTKVMDHSPRFWRWVEKFDPDYDRLNDELRHAWENYVPAWADARFKR